MSDLDIYLKGKPYELTKEQYAYCDDAIYGDKHVSNFSGGGLSRATRAPGSFGEPGTFETPIAFES